MNVASGAIDRQMMPCFIEDRACRATVHVRSTIAYAEHDRLRAGVATEYGQRRIVVICGITDLSAKRDSKIDARRRAAGKTTDDVDMVAGEGNEKAWVTTQSNSLA